MRFVPRRVPPRANVDMSSLDIFGRPARIAAEAVVGDDGTELIGGSEPVVKVYTVHSGISPTLPWTSKAQEESTGSGFSINHEGQMCILTNAHVVSDATYVEVRKAGDARKYVATRRKVSHECDLATLTVEDESFWKGTTPLEFGAVPCLQDEVSVVGYPEGGEGVSVTVGVVSRIEIQRYAHSGANLLAIQIDAAINPGNSGGPALDEDGRVIGVAFQNQQDSQNIGYVIPVPTIQHFLADTAAAPTVVASDRPTGAGETGESASVTAAVSATDGAADGDSDASSSSSVSATAPFERCRGFCSLGIFWQALENEELRR